MPDREKVIKALNMHFRKTCNNGDCPYATVGDCEGKLLFDALALIDAQHKLILELQNLISIGTKMMNGGD